MSMVPLHKLFPELATTETRVITLMKDGHFGLPKNDYAFAELYCVERDCDCRPVMINVLADGGRKHLATINHAFEAAAGRRGCARAGIS